MRYCLLTILLIPAFCFGQKFMVIEDDMKINERIANRISTLGYPVVKERAEADFIAQMIYEKKKGYMSKTGWKNKENKYNKVGYIAFLNTKGDTLSTTEEQGGYARYYNTYVALSELANKILKHDFDIKLKESITGFTPTVKKEKLTEAALSKADELAKLKKLMDEGVLTKEEFEAEKKKILDK